MDKIFQNQSSKFILYIIVMLNHISLPRLFITLLLFFVSFGPILSLSQAQEPAPDPNKCDWIQLNTVVPFIWDCIWTKNTDPNEVNTTNAFPKLMWSLSRILITAILISSFLMVVVWWVMIISWWIKEWNFTQWKTLIWKVIIGLALLWASWIILRLINPNFFG